MTRVVAYGDSSVLDVCGCGSANRANRARFLLPFEHHERLTRASTARVVRPRAWRGFTRRLLACSTPAYHSLRAVAGAKITILPYQLEPAMAVVRGAAARILIADEVGLGKTIQAGLVVAEVLRRTPDARVLIVTPAGLREQWQTELSDRLDVHATILDAAALARTTPFVNPWHVHRVVVSSIDFVKRPEVARGLEALVWDVIVFDEAHALCGRSDRAATATALANRGRTVVMLTATPHDGDSRAFERLAGTGDLKQRFPLLFFRRTRADMGSPRTRRTTWLKVRLSGHETRMHSALARYARLVWVHDASSAGARLAMSVLIRRACSSAVSLVRSLERRVQLLAGLPQQLERQIALPLCGDPSNDEEPASVLMASGLSDVDEERRLLLHLVLLARAAATSESKCGALARLLRRVAEPVVVFTEYRDTLTHLAGTIHEATLQLHGGMATNERRDVVREFTRGRTRILLATDAASEGLNLQHRCRLVVNLELPWTPLRLEQRIGRVDRLGQHRRVHALNLVARGTSEEMIATRLLQRIDRIDGALEALRQPGSDDLARLAIVGGGASTQDPQPLTPPPPGVIAGNLRPDAEREAEHIATARRVTHSTGVTAQPRPLIALARRRRHLAHSVVILQLDFADAHGQRTWESVIGVRCDPVSLTSHRRPHAWLAAVGQAAAHQIDVEHARQAGALALELRTVTMLAEARELAISSELTDRRARLARGLLQPSLFYARAERASSEQVAVLDGALAQCERRIGELQRHQRIVVGSARLLCAIAIR